MKPLTTKAMLEVNAIYYILMIEALVLAILLLLIGVFVFFFLRRRKRREVGLFANRLLREAAAREEQSRVLLQTVCQLDGEELEAAVTRFNMAEAELLEKLVQCLHRNRNQEMEQLHQVLSTCLETCKSVRPRGNCDTLKLETPPELKAVRRENEVLQTELSNARQKLDELMTEFGEIFGGGKDHELSEEEITARVTAIKAGKSVDS